MRCGYFEAGGCRSCTQLPVPYAEQLVVKEAATRAALADVPTDPTVPGWEDAAASREEGFRNKAKMVVGGTVEEPTLGILDPRGHGVDLRHCGLHEPGLHAALPVLADHVRLAGLTPYDVPGRRGELKHLLVTVSPDGELMVRWVLRSTESLPRLRKHLPWLLERLPVSVASANIQPEHKAVLEGPEEVLLTDQATLAMRLDVPGHPVVLQLRPQSFFQTNTAVATELYATARRWVGDLAPSRVWDLYSGVGGFALHLAAAPEDGRRVTGVEISAEAVEGARRAARLADLRADFVAGDAVAWATTTDEPRPDLLVVNPPRRGLGADLAGWVEASGVPWVLYSSCHSGSLARDLAAMPSYSLQRGRVLDMFPQTTHHEVLVLLRRR
ncbi:methyltransferase domain-containing protein [uncultured Nocardioides sp.]|uniref:methyltransferase domain-containing protein n=1 Tax=uncultured Nocardioides sp. TaxID=198441 RepID=UPI000C56451B|nr:methyltransferase domain-containing protein [uncultured Nocardioides sp.]MAO79473.1 23S rRNA (uracil(747)-C(5))-methyltransferase [Nocardioides sp.]